MDILSSRLKELRTYMGLKQTQLGDLIGVGKSTISMYETGNSTPGVEIIIKICDIFNVSVDYLLGRTDKNINNFELSNEEVSLLNSFNKLNNTGKKEAAKRISELSEITIYVNNNHKSSTEKIFENNDIKKNSVVEAEEIYKKKCLKNHGKQVASALNTIEEKRKIK